MTRRSIIIVSSVVAAVVAVFVVRPFFFKGEPDFQTVRVERGTIERIVSETGTVVASDDIMLFFKTSGRVKAVAAPEGTEVSAGDPIISLDSTELAARLRTAEAAVASADAKYRQALAGATAEETRIAEAAEASAETALASATEARIDADADLARTLASNDAALAKAYTDLVGKLETLEVRTDAAMGVLKNDVFDANESLSGITVPGTLTQAASQLMSAYAAAKTAQVSVDAAMVTLRTAADAQQKDALAAKVTSDAAIIVSAVRLADTVMQGSTPSGSVSQTTYDTRKAAVASTLLTASAALADANSQVSAIASLKAANASSLSAAQAAANAAKNAGLAAEAALFAARAELSRVTASLREVDKAVYLAAVASARADADVIRSQLSDLVIVAPVDGIIGSILLDVGELASPSAAAATLISPHYEIEADVSELDIKDVTVGLQVTVDIDAISRESLAGTVTKVASREKREDDDVFYTVSIELADKTLPLRSGMTADIDIVTARREDALLVPKYAVRRRNGSADAELLAGGKIVPVTFSVGIEGRDTLEATSGLREGDLIVVRDE